MSRTTRRILFYLFFFIFILLGVGITLYAQGYRISNRSLAVTTVGGLYITTEPSGASITLDGESIESNSGLFQKGTLLGGLFPKNHSLELSYPGYRPWKRTVSVVPSKVTEITNAVLIPEAITQVTTTASSTTSIVAFWLLGNNILLQNASGTLTFQSSTIAGTTPLGFNQSRTQFLSFNNKSDTYSLTNVQLRTVTPLKSLLAKIPQNAQSSSTRILMDTSSESRIFAITPRIIFWIDTEREAITPLISPVAQTNTVGAVESSRDVIAWSIYNTASSSSQIVLYDKFSRRTSVLPQIISGQVTALRWGGNNLLAAITAHKELSLIDLERRVTIERRMNVRDIYFSGDVTWLAILGEESIEVLSFRTPHDYVRFNLKDGRSISNLTWYRNNHGFFIHYPDHISFIEVDDTLQENIARILDGSYGTYDPETNRFYALSANSISYMQFPDKE